MEPCCTQRLPEDTQHAFRKLSYCTPRQLLGYSKTLRRQRCQLCAYCSACLVGEIAKTSRGSGSVWATCVDVSGAAWLPTQCTSQTAIWKSCRTHLRHSPLGRKALFIKRNQKDVTDLMEELAMVRATADMPLLDISGLFPASTLQVIRDHYLVAARNPQTQDQIPKEGGYFAKVGHPGHKEIQEQRGYWQWNTNVG